MNAGPLEVLRAARRLAENFTTCPAWCDHQHDLTGDDRGIDHECVVIGPSETGPVEAYLRAREMVDAPGVLGPVSLAVFTTEQHGEGWYLEIPMDEASSDIQSATRQVEQLLAVAVPPESIPRACDIDQAVIDLVNGTQVPRLTPAHH